MIIIGKCNKEALALFRKKYKNVVCVNRNASSGAADEVVCDGEKIAFMAVEHLIELGHTNIGYIGECRNEARYREFVEALHDHHLELECKLMVRSSCTSAQENGWSDYCI